MPCSVLILERAVTSRYDIFAINLASVMLGYVYGRTPGAALTQNAASCGPTQAPLTTTCRTWLDSAALQKSRLRDQSGGARWESIRATVVRMAGRHCRA